MKIVSLTPAVASDKPWPSTMVFPGSAASGKTSITNGLPRMCWLPSSAGDCMEKLRTPLSCENRVMRNVPSSTPLPSLFKVCVILVPGVPRRASLPVLNPNKACLIFAGGFTGYLAKTGDYSFESMKRAIIYGSCLASFCVEKFGTQRMEHLTKKEIDSRLQQFKSLTQYDLELS